MKIADLKKEKKTTFCDRTEILGFIYLSILDNFRFLCYIKLNKLSLDN